MPHRRGSKGAMRGWMPWGGSDEGEYASLMERIGSNVKPDPASGCWLWCGAQIPGGYGQIMLNRQGFLAHRLVYSILVDNLDDDQVLHHRCFTPACVNPDHLEPMTNVEHLALHSELRRSAPRSQARP